MKVILCLNTTNLVWQSLNSGRVLKKWWSEEFDHQNLQRTNTILVFCNRYSSEHQQFSLRTTREFFFSRTVIWLHNFQYRTKHKIAIQCIGYIVCYMIKVTNQKYVFLKRPTYKNWLFWKMIVLWRVVITFVHLSTHEL